MLSKKYKTIFNTILHGTEAQFEATLILLQTKKFEDTITQNVDEKYAFKFH